MDFCPAYWEMIDKHIGKGTVFIHGMVCDELTRGESAVADWIRDRKESGFVKELNDDATQEKFKKIIEFVNSDGYKDEAVAEFLAGADPWIIAACKAHGICTGHKRDL